MKNLFARNAKFEDVISDPVAVKFHSDRWASGQRDNLAKSCWQYLQHLTSEVKKNDSNTWN
jgi:hypothetical protein